MLFNKIIKSLCGPNDSEFSHSAFAIDKQIFNIGDSTPVESAMRITGKPELNITKIPGFDKTYIKVDIHFKPTSFNDANFILKYLNDYGKEISEITEESKQISQIYLTLVPLEYKGQYYIVASMPIFWCFTSTNVGQQPNVISILFDSENFILYETDEVDYEKIIALADKEASEEADFEAEQYDKLAVKKAEEEKRTETKKPVIKEKTANEILKEREVSNTDNNGGI